MNELIKLKTLWQTTLTETDRAAWRPQFLSATSTAQDLRHLIREHLQINLQHDWQLAEFRQWEFTQRAHAIHDEWLMQESRRLLPDQERPAAEPGRSRADEELLKQICLQTAFARQDYIALHAVRSAVRCSTLDLHRERFKESTRSKIHAGIGLLAEEAKKHPTIRAAVDNLIATIEAANPPGCKN